MAIPQRVWPAPEAEHMGGIMHKCWAGGFENMKQLKADVVNSLEDLGWTIEGDDNLRGVNFENYSLDRTAHSESRAAKQRPLHSTFPI
jgi:hypothetical protein